MKKILALLLIFVMLSGIPAAGFAEASDENGLFYRIDLDDPEAWSKELSNVRLLTEGKYSLKPLPERHGADVSRMPSLSGMNTLNISGSAQYSEQQFRDLAETLRECAGEDPIYVVDLRLESHAMLNGVSVSLYGPHNAANEGMRMEQVEADERERFGSMPGTAVTAYPSRNGNMGYTEPMTIDVENWMTEKELVESEGIGYFRICAPDKKWPEPELIDRFIDFVRELNMDHVWLHFHCHSGFGRTGIFMCIYDMMKNPDVSLEDIVARQAMTGSEYFLHAGHHSSHHGSSRAEMIRLVYEYIQENRSTNYEQSWSSWSKTHTALNLNDYDVLFLSNSCDTLESGALSGNISQIVVIPQSCKTICANAFEGAEQLKYVIIPYPTEVDIDSEALANTDAVFLLDTGKGPYPTGMVFFRLDPKCFLIRADE